MSKKANKKSLTSITKGIDAVVLSVHLLGGDQKSIDTEDVAIKVHAIAPGMFSWQKYPDQINLELIRVNLSNAKKPDNGCLLSGSGREGWRLTKKGLEWVNAVGQKLLTDGVQWDPDSKTAGSVDTVRKRREKARVLASSAWKHWSNGERVILSDARNLFRINEYSTGKMPEIKVVRLLSMFEDDAKLSVFLKDVSEIVLNAGDGK